MSRIAKAAAALDIIAKARGMIVGGSRATGKAMLRRATSGGARGGEIAAARYLFSRKRGAGAGFQDATRKRSFRLRGIRSGTYK